MLYIFLVIKNIGPEKYIMSGTCDKSLAKILNLNFKKKAYLTKYCKFVIW